MLNSDVIETISKFLDGPELTEFMFANRQMLSTVRNVIMRRFPILTISIPVTPGWAPVPSEYSGDVVYTIGSFVRDAEIETRQLVTYVTEILAELYNPARKHTISFELGVELPIDLALFDGCRYLKVVGVNMIIPDFRAIERLHIIPKKTVTYTAPIRAAVFKASDIGTYVVPDAAGRCKYTYDPPVHYSRFVNTGYLSKQAFELFPNIAPGFQYWDSTFKSQAYECRDVSIHPGENLIQYRCLQSASLWNCTNELVRKLNFASLAEFDPVVVPNVDFRVPPITYNRLESVKISGTEVTDIEGLSMITSLDIGEARGIERLPTRNRITKLTCPPALNFRFAPLLTDLNITGEFSEPFESARLVDSGITHLSLTGVQCADLMLPESVMQLALHNVKTGDIITFATKIAISKTLATKFTALAAAQIDIDKPRESAFALGRHDYSDSRFTLDAKRAVSLTIHCHDMLVCYSLPDMPKLQHLTVPYQHVDLHTLPCGLQTLDCKDVTTKTRSKIEITAIRFPKLTRVKLNRQWGPIVIKKELESLTVTASEQAEVTIAANCGHVEIIDTPAIINARVGIYRTNRLPGTRCSGSIGHLDINISDVHDELHYLHALDQIRFATLTIRSGHITRNLSAKNIPEITFIDCTFAPRVFASDECATKRIYTNTPDLCLRVPVYDLVTKRRVNQLPIVE